MGGILSACERFCNRIILIPARVHSHSPRSTGSPFEQAVGIDPKSAMSTGGALAAPVTAFQYDWNMLPIGRQLWLEHLES
jgi:hypothetical protein